MTDDVTIRMLSKRKLVEPVLIEGLPGVGNVGKLAADHMVDVLDSEHIASIYSIYLPPQVTVADDGVAKMISHELHVIRQKEGARKGKDLLVLTGDFQAISPEGQYILSQRTMDLANELGVTMVYTLGGYGLGKRIETPRVIGAVNDIELKEEMEGAGVAFQPGEPGAGIVGASGLLLGMASLVSVPAVCLMGETHGIIVDPKAARAVLEVLVKTLDLTIDITDLDEKAAEMEEIQDQIDSMNDQIERSERESTGYIR